MAFRSSQAFRRIPLFSLSRVYDRGFQNLWVPDTSSALRHARCKRRLGLSCHNVTQLSSPYTWHGLLASDLTGPTLPSSGLRAHRKNPPRRATSGRRTGARRPTSTTLLWWMRSTVPHPRGPADPPLRQRPRATVRHHESAALRPRPSVRLAQPHHAGPGHSEDTARSRMELCQVS